MIFADRTSVQRPSILDKQFRDKKTELDRALDHIFDPNAEGAFSFERYRAVSVKHELEKLFHGKCAYCESYYSGTQPVDVEHYRPKGGVEGRDDHPGYWWLAMAWDNLLPSCIDCNRRRQQKSIELENVDLARLQFAAARDRSKKLSVGKACAFPLANEENRSHGPESKEDFDAGRDYVATESPLLLNPTVDRLDEHLEFFVSRKNLIGLVLPKPLDENADAAQFQTISSATHSARGIASIQYYGLNRLGLVQARTKLLRDLEFLQSMFVRLTEISIELKSRIANPPAGVQTDMEFLQSLEIKISRLAKDTKARIRAKTEKDAPYSAFARAWVSAYIKQN